MAPGIIERIQAKIELFRLEQRYTRRRHRRSTFVSNAVYVDGEYIYNTPASTGSSTNSAATTNTSTSAKNPAPARAATTTVTGMSHTTDNIPSPAVEKPNKKLNRYSSMPGFGSLSKSSSIRQTIEPWRTGR